MSNSQPLVDSSSIVLPTNENFDSIDWAFVYSKRHEVTTGLIWGYRGGRWGGFAVAAGTFTLGNGVPNYLVVARATGVPSFRSNNLTDWENVVSYRRVYKITTAGGVVTAIEDHRAGPYGVFGYQPEYNNYWHTNQVISAASRTHLTGSNIPVPPTTLLQSGAMFRWTFSMTKTAAGVAASTFDIGVGTTANASNTARVSFTKPGGSADIDHAIVTIDAIIRSIGAAGVMVGDFHMSHNGFAAGAGIGHALIPIVTQNVVSGTFDTTVANLHLGVSLTSGAADAITIHRMRAEALRFGGETA